MMRGDAAKLKEHVDFTTPDERIIDYLEGLEDEFIARDERIEKLEDQLLEAEMRQKETEEELFALKLLVEEMKEKVENPPKTIEQIQAEEAEQQLQKMIEEMDKMMNQKGIDPNDYYVQAQKRKGYGWP